MSFGILWACAIYWRNIRKLSGLGGGGNMRSNLTYTRLDVVEYFVGKNLLLYVIYKFRIINGDFE